MGTTNNERDITLERDKIIAAAIRHHNAEHEMQRKYPDPPAAASIEFSVAERDLWMAVHDHLVMNNRRLCDPHEIDQGYAAEHCCKCGARVPNAPTKKFRPMPAYQARQKHKRKRGKA